MYEHTLISEHSNSLVLFLYIFLMYLKAESDHSTLALVAGMTNNISKKKKKKNSYLFFTNDRNRLGQRLRFAVWHFRLPNIVSIVSFPAEK